MMKKPSLFCLLLIYITCIKRWGLWWWFQTYVQQGPTHHSTPFPASPSLPLTPFLFSHHFSSTYMSFLFCPSRFQKWGARGIVFLIHLISVNFQRIIPTSILPSSPISNKLNKLDIQYSLPFVQVKSYFPVHYKEKTVHMGFWSYPHPRPVSREWGAVRAPRQVYVTHLPYDLDLSWQNWEFLNIHN